MMIKQLKTKNFTFDYSEDLEDFVKEISQIADLRKQELCKLFGCKEQDIPNVVTGIFSTREDFVNYIQKVTNSEQEPPQWAAGCFYNNGIQIHVNQSDIKQYNSSKFILPHELTHLFINKFIYDAYGIERLKWFDESFAYWLQGPLTQERIEQARRLAEENKNRQDFDMNIIESSNEDEFNAFPLYKIIGYYIFMNHLEKDYISTIINNRDDMVEIGKHVLKDSLDYVLLSKENENFSSKDGVVRGL